MGKEEGEGCKTLLRCDIKKEEKEEMQCEILPLVPSFVRPPGNMRQFQVMWARMSSRRHFGRGPMPRLPDTRRLLVCLPAMSTRLTPSRDGGRMKRTLRAELSADKRGPLNAHTHPSFRERKREKGIVVALGSWAEFMC